MTGAGRADVGLVVLEDAVVDDPGVQGRQGQGRHRLHGLQEDHDQEQPPVRAKMGAQQPDQHGRDSSHAVEEQPSHLGGLERLGDHHRMGHRQREGPQDPGRLGRLDGQIGAVGLEEATPAPRCPWPDDGRARGTGYPRWT